MPSCKCEVPCWSGRWFEIEGMGYMEVSDLDEQTHRPPTEAWVLVSVDYNILNSSQIFRYFPAEVMAELEPEPAGVEQ